MTTIIRLLLTLPACMAFCAAVAVASTAKRFGVEMLPFTGFYWGLVVVSGLGGFLGALLAPGWELKWRLLLLGVGCVLGAATGAGIGYIVEQRSSPVELIIGMTLWGTVLGLWLGTLHHAPVRGALAGLLLLGSVSGFALFLEHPDPAALFGATAGLLACTLLIHPATHRRLVLVTRGIAAGILLLLLVALVFMTPHSWPRMQRYHVAAGRLPSPSVMMFSPDGKQALATMQSGLYLWNVEDAHLLQAFAVGGGDIAVAAVCYPSADTACCIFIDQWGVITRWDAQANTAARTLIDDSRRQLDAPTFWDHPYALAASPDGAKAIVCDPLKAGTLWQVDFLKEAVKPIPHSSSSPVTAAAWIDHERFLLGCEGDGSLHLCTVKDSGFQKVKSFRAPFGQRSQLVVSPDGKFVCITASYPSSPLVMNLEQAGNFEPLGKSLHGGRDPTFSHDSRYLFWVEGGQIVHVWNLAEGREVRSYCQHRSVVLDKLSKPVRGIRGLAIRPDGKVAMSSTGSGLVRLWKLNHD